MTGQEMYEIANKLFPICRSITGNGVRQTFEILRQYLPEIITHEVPSGTKVFDWTVPKEWNIKEAFIEDAYGKRIIDMKQNNLYVMGYSMPVDKWVELEELKSIIYTQPEQPDVIPYVTSYYEERYGFCMSENLKNSLKEGKYHIVIESSMLDGALTYGECIIPGETEQEILITTYIDHPSMANNECSGPSLSVALANWVKKRKRKYTYRFVYVPETIGTIVYLNENLDYLKEHMIAGFVLSCVGDNNNYSFVETRYGNTLSDRVMENVLKYQTNNNYKKYSYLQRGSDEKHYNAPGIDLPVIAFCRTKYDEFPEYHTSADNMSFISAEGFEGGFDVMIKCLEILEWNKKYKTKILCEPQLSKRKLYPTISQKGNYGGVSAILNFLAYADGNNDLLDISHRIGIAAIDCLPLIEKLADILE